MNEAVNLLETLAPDRLERLRAGLPEDQRLMLKSGIIAGDDDRDSVGQDPKVAVALAQVALAALDEVVLKTEPALLRARGRLKLVNRWRLLAQVLTVLGSSVVIGTALIGETAWQFGAALLTLATSIATLLADQAERLLGGKSATAGEAFESLSATVFPAKQLKGELEVLLRIAPGSPELRARIADANALCERIYGWLPRLD